MQIQRRFTFIIGLVLVSMASSALASLAKSRRAVVEDLLANGSTKAHVEAALQNEKLHPHEEVQEALHLSLASIGVPVPPDVKKLADAAAKSHKVSPGEADRAAKILNKLLEEQRTVLDHKVIQCQQKQRRLGEAIQDAANVVRDLAAETSAARSTIMDATSRIPQDRRSFEDLKADAQNARVRCQDASRAAKERAADLDRDAFVVGAVRDALTSQCSGQASLVQNQEVERSLAEDRFSSIHFNRFPGGGSMEEVAHRGASLMKARKNEMMDMIGCPDVAAALGVVARKHGGGAATGFLQRENPNCKLTPHACAAMLDIAEEVSGEIADSQARLRATTAQARDDCEDDELFLKNQLAMETAQASDRSKELGESTWKAGAAGDLTNEKDSERQILQAELKSSTAKCTSEISNILYGKMCALQKVRDSLQVIAGRSELPEDCQVSDWVEGICSQTCGGGKKILTREVILHPKGGAACPPLSLTLSCGETDCPKDCEVSSWSSWSACSAQCDGGIQERNRVVSKQPVGNGVACPGLVDMRLCNTDACSSDCEFLQWTPWKPCNRACGGGSETRSRGLRDEGKASCPKGTSSDRFQVRKCNTNQCDKDNNFRCSGAPMDIVLLLDASGSMTDQGFTAVKALASDLVKGYNVSEGGTKVSVVAFAKQAKVIAALSDDSESLSSKIASKLNWLRGPSNAGAGLTRAASLLSLGGRQEASSLVLLVTDGRLVDPFLARQAAVKLKGNGIRLAFALIGTEYKNEKLLEAMASVPDEDNIIKLPDFSVTNFVREATNLVVSGTCSAVQPLD